METAVVTDKSANDQRVGGDDLLTPMQYPAIS